MRVRDELVNICTYYTNTLRSFILFIMHDFTFIGHVYNEHIFAYLWHIPYHCKTLMPEGLLRFSFLHWIRRKLGNIYFFLCSMP